jgi:hypothetical protein
MPRVVKLIGGENLTRGALFTVLLAVFWLSPVVQVTDAKFALLLSRSLWRDHTFTLDSYGFPPAEVGVHGKGALYQLHAVQGHVYYAPPPGSSVLSAPLVGAAEWLGIYVVNAAGKPDTATEAWLQVRLASLLMAALGLVFYLTARLLLARWLSLIVALGGALGTQIWSTAARGLWAHTWNALLWGVVLWLLLRAAARERQPNPFALATLLAWTYFVRPTSALGVIAVTVYVFMQYRAMFLRYALTGAAWAGLFVVWSWQHYGSLLPEYYQAGRLYFGTFGTALAGHLISPARGQLVYVPALLFVIYLLARHRREVPHKGLAALALAIIGGQLFSASAYEQWWGGNSFGPRFLTDVAPCFALLAVLGLAARSGAWRRAEAAAGLLLVAASVFINGRGALSEDTWRWNKQPQDISDSRWRLWDWRQPQFMAGWRAPLWLARATPLPLPGRIDFTAPEADAYLRDGWSGPEPAHRWNDGREALVFFGLAAPQDVELSLNLGAFLVPGRLDEQTVAIELNGQTLDTLRLTDDRMRVCSYAVRAAQLRQNNTLRLLLPNAAAPSGFRDNPASADTRLLGVRVAWLEIKPQEAR